MNQIEESLKSALKSNLVFVLVLVLFSTTFSIQANAQTSNCPKKLELSECANPPSMHGQIMVHNLTKKSFIVTVEHHPTKVEEKRIAPGDGWTFMGVLQGKSFITAKSSDEENKYESSCTVIGNTQHMMNITAEGIKMMESNDPSHN